MLCVGVLDTNKQHCGGALLNTTCGTTSTQDTWTVVLWVLSSTQLKPSSEHATVQTTSAVHPIHRELLPHSGPLNTRPATGLLPA
jgi:hypothetical protein